MPRFYPCRIASVLALATLILLGAAIRALAAEADVGLADPYAAFERHADGGGDVADLLAWPNHPNRRGHELIADELMRWVPLALPAP